MTTSSDQILNSLNCQIPTVKTLVAKATFSAVSACLAQKVQELKTTDSIGENISMEMSLIRLTKSLRWNKEMKPTITTVKSLWAAIVIHQRITLMRKKCTEMFMVFKILKKF